MKLYFLDTTSKTAINVGKLKKSGYNVRRLIASIAPTLDTLIVLGDGTPDDKVLGVIFHHLNGNKIVGIVKPQVTRLGAIDQLKTYLKPNITRIMILLDQETTPLTDLIPEITNRIECEGITIDEENQTETSERLRTYRCSLSNRNFELILVINGIDEVATQNHAIEDHLLKVANLEEECRRTQNSKETWSNLTKVQQEEIFRSLQNRNLVIDNFPQQFNGCRRLESAPDN